MDDERNLSGLSDDERSLQERLDRLGPLLLEYSVAEAELNSSFASDLRARLISGAAPGVAARPVRNPLQQPKVWTGVVAAAVATAIAVTLAVLLPHHAAPTINAPYPTRAELLFGLPAPAIGARSPSPTTSLLRPRPAIPYAGRLRLSAGHVPAGPAQLSAYRLASPGNVVVTGRALLDIRSPVRRVAKPAGPWLVAADGGHGSHEPLHSLALSLKTDEVIYHDRRNLRLPHAEEALSPVRATRVARRWLTMFGWPGKQMPLIAVDRVPDLPKVREVRFGWIGVGASGVDAATLWVTPDRSVIEAWLWPPVERRGSLPARSLSAAWSAVRAGSAPITVPGVPPNTRSPGSGSLARSRVISILSAGKAGTMYLVPAYRFQGTVDISGAGHRTWLSLVPGALR